MSILSNAGYASVRYIEEVIGGEVEALLENHSYQEVLQGLAMSMKRYAKDHVVDVEESLQVCDVANEILNISGKMTEFQNFTFAK